MKTYYAIKNNEGRYLKVRTNGGRSWVEGLKAATVGTEAQMLTYIEHNLFDSPYKAGCELVKVGEAESAWKAKFNALTTKKENEETE